MGGFWIIILLMCLSAWESFGITNKGRPLEQKRVLRNFRDVPEPSRNVNTDWEIGLREAANQALLRERYHDYNLRERLFEAPLIGRQDAVTPFGDIVILARGQLYVTHGGSFLFVQDRYQNDCDACHIPRQRCIRSQCQIRQPDENERLVALWTVKRLRHRDHNDRHYYELEYIVSPITTSISQFVTRNGHFDYSIPGHIFVVRNDKVGSNQLQIDTTFVNNKHIPHHHFKPDVVIGITPDGEKHILHSYPGFYTSLPVHPTYHQNRYSTNDPREIELYKNLIESLAAKTSSTQKAETGPYKFSLNKFTKPVTDNIQPTKPSYESFPSTQSSVVKLPTGQLVPLTKITSPLVSTTVEANTPTYTSVPFPYTNYQENIPTKPSIINIIPTKPTELNTQDLFANIDTMNPTNGYTSPEITRPIETIFHYFTPVGEENLVTDGITEMKKITLHTTSTKATAEQKSEESGSDFLFPEIEKSTMASKTTKKYYKATTSTQKQTNVLEEPASSPTQITKQYPTTAQSKQKSISPKTTKIKSTPLKSTIKSSASITTKPKLNTINSRLPKTTTKFTTPKTIKTTNILRTEVITPAAIGITAKTNAPKTSQTVKTTTETTLLTSKITEKINLTKYTPTTDIPNITPHQITTLKLQPMKIKQSNLTGFIASTHATIKTNITTYKPNIIEEKSTTIKTNPTTTIHGSTEPTTFNTQMLPTMESAQQKSTLPTITKTTPQQEPSMDLDYSLLEEISPTEPMQMTPHKPKPQETSTTSFSPQFNYTTATTSHKTITTQKSDELSSDSLTTTITEITSQITFAPTSDTSKIITSYTQIPTIENIITEPLEATSVTQDNKTDFTTQKEMEITTEGFTKITTTFEDNFPTYPSTQQKTDNTEILTPTIETDFTTNNVMSTGLQQIKSSTQPSSSKTTTIKIIPSTTMSQDFLMGNNIEKTNVSKPIKTDFDEDDIFGPAKTETKPTKAYTVKEITESDLAGELFGNEMKTKLSSASSTTSQGSRIIYSNFYRPSTTPLPQTNEYVTQTESGVTMNFKPLTSQSFATSISFKVNKKSDNNNTENNPTQTTLGTTINDIIINDGKQSDELIKSTTEAISSDMKKTFDNIALQLINHAKSIDYLSGNGNKTNRVKYKRRKTYIPKNRRTGSRKQVP